MDRGDVGWQGPARTGKWEGKEEGGETGRNIARSSRERGREEKQAGTLQDHHHRAARAW
jgi:hypothetical protein